MLRSLLPASASVLALGLSASVLAAPVRLDLPGQSLSQSLDQLSRLSGLRISYEPNLVSGRQAPPLSGTLEPAQALSHLLSGSGLAAAVNGSTATVYAAGGADAQGAMTLGAVDINARESLAGAATTEGTNSYTTGSMSTATKLPLSIRETPQSVSVITRQRIEDQGMNSLDDVVKYAPGVTYRRYGGDRLDYRARGFKIDNIMYDGLPTNVSQYTQDTIASGDLAMYDRVELVRGATGLMTGAGSPSATLNLVRKRPTAAPQVSITGSAGSWDRYRTEVDASNKLNQAGTIRGRVVAAYEDNKSFIDERNTQRQTFYGILEADLSDATTWTIGASRQRNDNTSDWGGLPVGRNGQDLHLSRSTFLSNDWAYWDQDNYTLFSDITHRFENGWTAKVAGSKIWAEADTFSSYLSYSGNGFTQGTGVYKNDDDQTNIDASASGPFQLFGREHELVVGASRRQEKFDQVGGWWNGPVIDVYNFNRDLPKPSIATRNPYSGRNTTTEEGVYAAARFNPSDPLHVIVGSRVSWFDYENRVTGDTYSSVREVTPYAGVIYDLNDTYSAYASYTEIFKPQSQQDVGGSLLEPMTGKSYEIGLKAEYFGGDLNASVALFDMTQESRSYALVDQPASCAAQNRTCYAAAGEVRSQGIDAEVTGALTPDWQFTAAYTYVLSEYTKDRTYQGSLFAPDQPKHLFKAATTYRLTGDLSKWRVGADVFAQSDTYNRVGTGRAEQDAYAVFGLMAGYRFDEHWDARVNFNNVFDEKYWQGIPTGAGFGTYGDPRNLMFSVKWSL